MNKMKLQRMLEKKMSLKSLSRWTEKMLKLFKTILKLMTKKATEKQRNKLKENWA